MANHIGAFNRWRELQSTLHELERQLTEWKKLHRNQAPPTDLADAVARTRREVDELFPGAMIDMEEQIARASARRYRLHD